MKNNIYDYTKLRWSNITSPEYRHVLLLLGWIIYFIFYGLTENLIPVSRCHVVHTSIDDLIPFVEYFVIVYVSWFVMIVISLGYFFFTDIDSFKSLQIFIIVTQVVAMIIYIIWPSVQLMRPAEFERQNFCTWLLSIIYAFDTPTGVCPSLHVAYSLGIMSTWLKRKNSRPSTKIIYVVWTALVCVAVLFVKQHSFLDVLVALPVSLLAEIIVFGPTYWRPRLKGNS